MFRHLLGVAALLLPVAGPLLAQGPVPLERDWKGAGYLEMGGSVFLFSANDENRYGPVWVRIGAGLVFNPPDTEQPFLVWREEPERSFSGLGIPLAVGTLLGGAPHFLELSTGMTGHFHTKQRRLLYATGGVGYRFVRLRDGLLFRITLVPMLSLDGNGNGLAWGISLGRLQW